MIIWLNGAFGAGKTTCAFELNRRIPDSFVYDPENIGYFLRKNLPEKLHKADFQDHEQWRSFNYEIIKYLNDGYDGTVIIPMTVVNRSYYDEIIQKLLDGGVRLKHFILYADRETLLKRLNKRLEGGGAWAKAQIDRCIDAFNNDITEIKIITDARPIGEIVEEIAKTCGISLLPDNRGRIKKETDRIFTLLKHIRR